MVRECGLEWGHSMSIVQQAQKMTGKNYRFWFGWLPSYQIFASCICIRVNRRFAVYVNRWPNQFLYSAKYIYIFAALDSKKTDLSKLKIKESCAKVIVETEWEVKEDNFLLTECQWALAAISIMDFLLVETVTFRSCKLLFLDISFMAVECMYTYIRTVRQALISFTVQI